MKFRVGLTVAAIGVGIAFAGCGDDEKSAESTGTPAQAIAEIGETRAGIDAALATYAAGDATKADEQVGDAYLKHFEEVEGPLEEVDHELTEKLEDAIREELRGKIKAKAPAAEVNALADSIKADLDKAAAALK